MPLADDQEPRRPLVIGITGHRILTEEDRLIRGVRAALDAITTAWPNRPLVVLTCLAEGADRLAADVAENEFGATVRAILPMPAADYRKTFEIDSAGPDFDRRIAAIGTRAAKEARLAEAGRPIDPALKSDVEVLSRPETPADGYLAAMRLILQRSHVVLALWEGPHRPHPTRYGSDAMVASARSRGVPLAWVRTGHCDESTREPKSFGPDQGALVLERFPRMGPPKPPCILRVGVTAHHDPNLARNPPEALREVIRGHLMKTLEVATAVFRNNRRHFGGRELSLHLVTRAADGAEVVAIEIARDLGYTIDLVLPYPHEDYALLFADGTPRQSFEATLASAGHVLELDGRGKEIHAAREATNPRAPSGDDLSEMAKRDIAQARLCVSRNCDFLLAIYDPAHNLHGLGTTSVVRAAQDALLPISTIDVSRLEGIVEAFDTELPRDLDERLQRLLLPATGCPTDGTFADAPSPSTEAGEKKPSLWSRVWGKNVPPETCYSDYLEERERRPLGGALWLRFRKLVGELGVPKKPKQAKDGSDTEATADNPTENTAPSAAAATPPWRPHLPVFLARRRADGEVATHLTDRLPQTPWLRSSILLLRRIRRRVFGAPKPIPASSGPPEGLRNSPFVSPNLERCYGWATMAANHYGDLTRSAFIGNYLGGALAVAAALASIGLGWDDHHHPMHHYVWVTSVVEILLIVTIVSVTLRGKRCKWHTRWIDYRLLGENLRTARALAPLARTPPNVRLPPEHAHSSASTSWIYWYLRSWLRDFGPSRLRFTQDHVTGAKNVVLELIGNQRDFHLTGENRFEHAAERLHGLGVALFVISGLSCLAHLVVHHSALTFFGGFLPALGGGLAAIASQGEFERLARRSRSMVQELDYLRDRLSAIEPDPGQPRPLPPVTFFDQHVEQEDLLNTYSARVGDVAHALAAAMVEEVLDWRTLFAVQEIKLPG